MAGLNSELLISGDQEEEECTKPRKQTPTRQPFKKGQGGISECSTHGSLLLIKCSAVSDQEQLLPM